MWCWQVVYLSAEIRPFSVLVFDTGWALHLRLGLPTAGAHLSFNRHFVQIPVGFIFVINDKRASPRSSQSQHSSGYPGVAIDMTGVTSEV